MFEDAEIHQFERDGFVISRGLIDLAICEHMLSLSRDQLSDATGPVELEADVRYPGAPPSRSAPGGTTIRRLQNAISRDPVFLECVNLPGLKSRLRGLLGDEIVMPLAHHNCIMTKQPEFSSDTGWHQDIRYWSFESPELVSVWIALGPERPKNGGLYVIPGTHRLEFDRSRLDGSLFLREDLPENQALIEQRVPVELAAGDVLFFHCRTFHSASRNRSPDTKYSVVFTFRPADNHPNPDTRSNSQPELLLSRE